MHAFTLEPTLDLIKALVALDPLNIPVTEKIAVKMQHVSMGRSPPSSGPVRVRRPVLRRHLLEGTLTGSTRLVLVTVLVSRLPSMDRLMGSAKLVFLNSRAPLQLAQR